ncbi:MAG: Gfo/Idh/MocA family protein [Phycisphaeraceae bacterium]
MTDFTRRDFVKTSAYTLGAVGLAGVPGVANALQQNPTAGKDKLRVVQIGVAGIGGLDMNQVNSHPNAEIVGLCDVDSNHLDKAKARFPDAFAEKDYRKIFADRKNDFDAVIVSTPDHHHAPMLLTALAHDKHVYGQKPLVQQLEELPMLERAIAAKPYLATQTGNQRMKEPGRRVAVEILQKGMLGKAVEAYVWAATRRGRHTSANQPEFKDPPAHLDWDLWLGPCKMQGYQDGKAHNHWRAWWDHGTAGLGDWGVHLLDILMYAYPELTSPMSVMTNTPRAADWYHTAHCQATLAYDVSGSDRFDNDFFAVHYSDSRLSPSMRALGVSAEKWADSNMTVVVCEEGTLTLDAGGKNAEVWRKGVSTPAWKVDGVSRPRPFNHWHVWVDKALGDQDAPVWTPFEQGIRITEAAVLPVKASRFPGQELMWDRKSLTFTNHQKATDTVVRRQYRDGFAPPKAFMA